MGRLKAEQAVVGAEDEQAQLLGNTKGDPLVATATQGGRWTGVVGNAAVAGAEDQDLDELVEDDPVGDARAVAAQRMGVISVR